ncbi:MULTISPECIES: hypothetical protein [unclassified Haladaptatus]|uniref:hypothetical protein n=1 Tax=unclassified Haladaptatus TaxID=2622732 RepID=UPI0023E8F8F0|nr:MULTISPECIES: hypothetical protein [unclassified Haladaptatus]
MPDYRAIGLGALAQTSYLGVLYAAWPLRGQLLQSLVLVALTGVIGGVIAGRLAGEHGFDRTSHGFASGLCGGAVFALTFYLLKTTPGLIEGAYWSVGYVMATTVPFPELMLRDGGLWLVVGWSVFGGVTIALVGLVAGYLAPPADQELVFIEE